MIAHSPSASSTSCSGRTPWRANARDIRSCSATSHTIVRRPVRAAASPSAAATVVFPTPPLPVTYSNERSRNSASTVVHPSGSHGTSVARGIRDGQADAAPPRPDLLPRHAPPAGADPTRHVRPLRLRARGRSARRRPAPARHARGAPRSAGRVGGAAAGASASRRAARSPTPPAATASRSASCALHALDAGGLRAADPDRHATSSSATYMDGSAGTVGRIMAALLGVPPDHHADIGRLGVAFQLANFIRDVREDRRLDRIYLPAEDREAFGVSDADLTGSSPPAARPAQPRVRARPRPVRRRRPRDRRRARLGPARRAPRGAACTAGCSTARVRRACACGTCRERRSRPSGEATDAAL